MDKRSTWAYHYVDGWYLATSDEHYQAHKCYVKTIKGERVSDTTIPTQTHHEPDGHPTGQNHACIGKMHKGHQRYQEC